MAITIVTGLLLNGSGQAVAAEFDPAWLSQSRQQLQIHFDAGEYAVGMRTAERIVEWQDSSSVSASYEHANDIHNLAVLLQQAGRLARAEQSFKRSISMIEGVDGIYSPLLVPSLNHLAVLCYLTDQLSESLDLLRRSQHITQRSDGVYSLDQLEAVSWISKVLVAANKSPQADVQERLFLRIHEENFGADDARILPAMSRLGDWLQISGQYREALQVYRRAVTVIEGNDAISALQAVPLLRDMSSNLYLMEVCCPSEPLRKAVDIVVSDPTTDPLDEAQAMIHLADMHLLRARGRKARNLYKQAWRKLAQATISGQGSALQPSRLNFDDPSPIGLVGASAVVEAYRRVKPGGKPSNMNPGIRSVQMGTTDQREESNTTPADSVERVLIGTPLQVCYAHVVNLVPRKRRDKIDSYYVESAHKV